MTTRLIFDSPTQRRRILTTDTHVWVVSEQLRTRPQGQVWAIGRVEAVQRMEVKP